jgi:Tfp pilus assembly protein FimV
VLTLPAAAVKVSGGYLYVARPGDTLWAIASRLQPGGDPRPLVAELEQQLHGAQLVAGDRLTLP